MKKLVYSFTALMALTGSGVFAAEKPAAAPAMPPTAVLVEKVTKQSESVERKYVGWLEAIESVSLPSRVSGVLQKKHFTEGSPVKKGALLFEIEDTTYKAQVQLAKSQVKQLEAELAFARTNYERQKNLRDGKAVAEIAYEEAERVLHTTEAALDGARAKLLDAENNLSYTKIYAPIGGVIGKSTYSVGNYITPGSGELADIVQINPLYIRFAISSRELQDMFLTPKLMLQNTGIRLQLPDGKFYRNKIRITMLDNQIDNQTGTITVWATVQNPQGHLRPGGYMPVMLRNAAAPELPAVTLSAVMVDDKGHYVYVVDAENKVVSRRVEIGRINGSWQLIRSGLKVGETVVVDGNHKVRPGMVVNPIPAEAR